MIEYKRNVIVDNAEYIPPSDEALDVLDAFYELPAKTRANRRNAANLKAWKAANPGKVREQEKRRTTKLEALQDTDPEAARKHRKQRATTLKAWKDANPEAVRRHERRRKNNDYHRAFVSIDAEGMDIPGNDIVLEHGAMDALGNPLPGNDVYPEHRTILWGAKGWKRTYTATQLADNPSLPRTTGEPTPDYWLGTPDKRPLSSFEILEWLTSLPEKFSHGNGFPDGVNFVAFSFGYDATQILNDLPYKKVWEITRKKKYGTKKEIRGPIFVGPYAIDYLKAQHFEVWKLRDPDKPYRVKIDKNGNKRKELDSTAYINIQDAFGFYQESFIKATASLVKNGYITKEQHDIIATNKGMRDNFANLPFEQIKNYCALELEALSKALILLRDGFDKMGIRLKSWTGAGAAAGAFIRKLELKDKHYSPDIASNDLSLQQVRAHHAFVGGRIELIKQGYAPGQKLFVYDIASAYPAGLAELFSMKGGTWEHGEGYFNLSSFSDNDWDMLSMFCVEWVFDRIATDGLPVPFYPFPYRVKKKGQIIFPRRGKAWIMRDELSAGIAWFRKLFPKRKINDCMRVTQWSGFHPASAEKPYASLKNLYRDRLAWKRVGDIIEKNIKLTINALYGKTAQSVGSRNGPPSSACPYYAAATTAYCRARLLRFAILDPHAIVSFMTDGIVSTRELKDTFCANVKPEGAENIELGDWEMKTVKGGFLLMSGLYALLEEDGRAKTKTRGFNPHNFILRKSSLDFFREDVLNTWKKPVLVGKSTRKDVDPENCMLIENLNYKIRRYVTAGEACASPNRFRLIGRWADVTRSLDVHSPGTKRTFKDEDMPENSLPFWAYTTPHDTNGQKLKIPSLKELKPLENWLGASAREIQECLKAGEALRCRFLIPTAPAVNLTPRTLSAPSVPDWIDPDAGLGGHRDEELSNIALLEQADADTAEIMAG
jgi:hypothetical protein